MPRASRSKSSLPHPTPRAKLWLDIGPAHALTDAGADLLEQIHACGSLSQAARNLRFAYRRAWLLVDAMNKTWPSPLVATSTGGTRGGGARLTPLGTHVLSSYRDLQLRLEHFLDTNPFPPLPPHDLPE